MTDAFLYQLRVIMQRDVNHRGLGTIPGNNLLTACKDDFAGACRSLATTPKMKVGIVTGFWIPAAKAAETDGPFGALFLARVLNELGADVTLMAEEWCAESLRVGIQVAEKETEIKIEPLPSPGLRCAPPGATLPWPAAKNNVTSELAQQGNVAPGGAQRNPGWGETSFSHLIAIERVGPSHTMESFLAQPRSQPAPVDVFTRVPAEHYDQCHTMRGQIVTEFMAPVEPLFANKSFRGQAVTIGIGDGSNEIGMGKIPWEVIATNVPNGAITACRVATDFNLVCGISNWGAYALGVGVWKQAGKSFSPHLFNIETERIIGEKMVAEAGLVDGMTGQRALLVDGLPWDVYSRPIAEMFSLLAAE